MSSTRDGLSVSVDFYKRDFAEICPDDISEVEIRLIEKRQKLVRTINGLNVLIEDEVVGQESKVFRNEIYCFFLTTVSERIVSCMLSVLNVGQEVQDFLTKPIARAAKEMADLAMENGFGNFGLLAVVEAIVVESFDEGVDESETPRFCRSHLPKKRCRGDMGGSFGGEVCHWVKG